MQYREDREHQRTEKYIFSSDDSLAGKTFVLAMDDGKEYTVRFRTGTDLMWAKQGEPFRQEKYACLEADESTFDEETDEYIELPTCQVRIGYRRRRSSRKGTEQC